MVASTGGRNEGGILGLPPIRVAIVCDFLLKYGSNQARSLVQSGADVRMVVRSHSLEFGGSDAEREAFLAGLAADNVRVHVVPARIRSPGALPALARIRRELRKWQPDVVHVHENHDPRLLALTAGYRTVFTIHDPVEHLGAREFSRIDTLVYRRWCSRAERFVIHSGTLVEELPPHIDRRRVVVIPHGTWPRPVPLPPPRQPVVLLFGRLEKYKGVDVLLAAMPRVWERRADVGLIVAGAGPATKLVPRDPRITLYDRYVPEPEVDGLLAQASLVVLPYTQASQSGVGLLAVGAGVPVVVSNLGALPELVHDPTLIATAGDPADLAQAVVHHIDHGPEFRAGVLEHARARFSWSHVADRTVALYRELIDDAGS